MNPGLGGKTTTENVDALLKAGKRLYLLKAVDYTLTAGEFEEYKKVLQTESLLWEGKEKTDASVFKSDTAKAEAADDKLKPSWTNRGKADLVAKKAYTTFIEHIKTNITVPYEEMVKNKTEKNFKVDNLTF